MDLHSITFHDQGNYTCHLMDSVTWRTWAHFILDNPEEFESIKHFVFVEPGPEERAFTGYHITVYEGPRPEAVISVKI